jgi:hypothetical protein
MNRLLDRYFRERFHEITAAFPVERVHTRGAGYRQRKPDRRSGAVQKAITARLERQHKKAAARAAVRRLERALR